MLSLFCQGHRYTDIILKVVEEGTKLPRSKNTLDFLPYKTRDLGGGEVMLATHLVDVLEASISFFSDCLTS